MVTAFECQPALVELSQQLLETQNLQAEIMHAEPDYVPEAYRSMFDGLILGWGAYIHIAGQESRIRFLKQFRTHVNSW